MKTLYNAGKRITALPAQLLNPLEKSSYAYVISNTDYNIHKAIYHLQKAGVIVQSAFRPFTATINGKNKTFGYGSILVPVQQQRISSDSLYKAISVITSQSNINCYGLSTGFSAAGVDAGSSYMRTLKQPMAVMIVGTGVAAPEAGEVWHLLDQRLQMPITKLDILNLSRADLNRYNTMIMVSGNYTLIDKATSDKIKAWVQSGNTLITIKSGTEWAIKNGFTKEKLLSVDTAKGTPKRQDFDMSVHIEGAKSMGGSIFRADLDTTHPLGFGFTNREISLYRNGLTFLQPSVNPYSTILQYTANPLIGGYVHESTLKKIKNSAAILVGGEGSGRVIMFSDNPNFRGTWYGTNKLFLNALFYGGNIAVPQAVSEAKENSELH